MVIEITEGGLLTGRRAPRQVTHELRETGVSLALDDFGTGYSSLAHLHEIPLTTLKIDRAFVVGLNDDQRVERFMKAVLRLGEDLVASAAAWPRATTSPDPHPEAPSPHS